MHAGRSPGSGQADAKMNASFPPTGYTVPRHSLHLDKADAEVWAAIVAENGRQESHVELIA